MAHAVRMPKPGQMTETCVLTMWRTREGDPVHVGDVLFEIETDKASMEVEAFDDGVLLRQVVAAGSEVPVNAICGYIGEPGEVIPDEPEIVPDSAPGVAAAAAAIPAAAVPAAAFPAEVTARTAAPATAVATDTAGSSLDTSAGAPLRISPRAIRLATEAGVDPTAITGSGPDGRIVERDIQAAIQVAATHRAVVAPGSGDEEPPRPLSRMRRVIAERLTLSATTIPTFTLTVAVDVTGLLAYRSEQKALGTNLSVTDFVLAAVAGSLVEFADVNARTDGVSVWPRRRVHLGLAVSLPAGLVVPVIRDADRLGVEGLHEAAARLAAAARDNRLSPDELTGSTFTVSNLGMFGVDEFSAIINPGESGSWPWAARSRCPSRSQAGSRCARS